MPSVNELATHKILIIDGAMGTQIQALDIPDSAWEGNQGADVNATV